MAYAVRGLSAYTHHAEVLGYTDREVDEALTELYAFLCSEEVRALPGAATAALCPALPSAQPAAHTAARETGEHAEARGAAEELQQAESPR